jgi:hypothetical protein
LGEDAAKQLGVREVAQAPSQIDQDQWSPKVQIFELISIKATRNGH